MMARLASMALLVSLLLSLTVSVYSSNRTTVSLSSELIANIWWSPVVNTTNGPVQGYSFNGVNHYFGIPFAQPPVGSLRFQSPVEPDSWSKVRSALFHHSFCPQFIALGVWLGDEDCLYVNVYQPNDMKPNETLAVKLWIYGGAFVSGDGYEFGLYSGTNLVNEHRYIVVTFNYRLGALGFMALNALSKADPMGITGNAAIADQISAMKWVQANIDRFGGDPKRVTLAGESAGAMSVCLHLASPLSQGLFHAAIIESGTCDSPTFFVSMKPSVDWSVEYAHSVGCHLEDSNELIDCLRKLPTNVFIGQSKSNESFSVTFKEDVLKRPVEPPFSVPNDIATIDDVKKFYATRNEQLVASSTFVVSPPPLPVLYPTIPWAPTIDGVVLTDTPLAMIKAGKGARVPLIIGTNLDEGTLFIRQLYQILPGRVHSPLVDADLPVILEHVFQNDSLVNEILLHYPADQYQTINNLTEILLRDFFFACPSRRLLYAMSALPEPQSTWLYQFSYLNDWIESRFLGVYHSSELEFVWNNAWPPLVHSFSTMDDFIGDFIGEKWSGLVKAGDPNDARFGVSWPQWSNETRLNLLINRKPRINEKLLDDQCDFWDSVAAQTRRTFSSKLTHPLSDAPSFATE